MTLYFDYDYASTSILGLSFMGHYPNRPQGYHHREPWYSYPYQALITCPADSCTWLQRGNLSQFCHADAREYTPSKSYFASQAKQRTCIGEEPKKFQTQAPRKVELIPSYILLERTLWLQKECRTLSRSVSTRWGNEAFLAIGHQTGGVTKWSDNWSDLADSFLCSATNTSPSSTSRDAPVIGALPRREYRVLATLHYLKCNWLGS
jgi:hypothetical protein